MTLAIKSQGTLVEVEQLPLQSGNWVEIKEISAVPPTGAQTPEIDCTHLRSTAKEYLLGLPDEGTIQLTGNYLGAGNDAGQDYCWDRYNDQTAVRFRVTLSEGTVMLFTGLVRTFDFGVAVDDKAELTIGIRLSGARSIT